MTAPAAESHAAPPAVRPEPPRPRGPGTPPDPLAPLGRPASEARRRRVAVRLAYVGVVAVATLRGLDASPDLGAASQRLARAVHPMVHASDAVDALRNVALFAGFGAVWLASSGTRRLRRAAARATLAGVLLSATVEAAQLFSPTRMASVLDVLTNGTGALIGAATAALSIAALARARRPAPLGPTPLLAVALPYAAACAVEAFSPFGRPDRVPGAAGGPAARWAASVAHWRLDPWAPPAWTDLLLFAPAGALLALWAAERGRTPPRAARAAALAAAPAWMLAELLRGVVGGDVRPLAALAHTGAAALGAGAVAWWLGREAGAIDTTRAWLARHGLAALAGLALLWSLRPFAPERSAAAITAKLAGVDLRPLESLFTRSDVYGVADVAVGFLLYVPLGAWLASRAEGRGGVWPGLALAVGSEAAQLFVAGRTVDVTDALVQGAGVLIGWAVVRRATRRRAGEGETVPGGGAGGGGAVPVGQRTGGGAASVGQLR